MFFSNHNNLHFSRLHENFLAYKVTIQEKQKEGGWGRGDTLKTKKTHKTLHQTKKLQLILIKTENRKKEYQTRKFTHPPFLTLKPNLAF